MGCLVMSYFCLFSKETCDNKQKFICGVNIIHKKRDSDKKLIVFHVKFEYEFPDSHGKDENITGHILQYLFSREGDICQFIKVLIYLQMFSSSLKYHLGLSSNFWTNHRAQHFLGFILTPISSSRTTYWATLKELKYSFMPCNSVSSVSSWLRSNSRSMALSS